MLEFKVTLLPERNEKNEEFNQRRAIAQPAQTESTHSKQKTTKNFHFIAVLDSPVTLKIDQGQRSRYINEKCWIKIKTSKNLKIKLS